MKSRISLSFCVWFAVGFIAAGTVDYYDLHPSLFRAPLSSAAREALGCLDEGGGKLLDDYHRTLFMSVDTSIDAVEKFFQLRSLTDDASLHIEAMDDCYASLVRIDTSIDRDGTLRDSLDTMTDAYQGIFLGEATAISRSIREAVGIAKDEKDAPGSPTAPKSDVFMKAAEGSFATMSTRIGSIATR